MRAVEDSGEKGLLVDVGCGGGLLLRMLRERGLPVLGLETSLPAATSACKRNGVAVVCGALSESPVERVSCAAVTVFHVLEHLANPVSYVRSAIDPLPTRHHLLRQ